MALRARRFRYDVVLNQCLDGTHRITMPPGGQPPFEAGRHIRKIQRALIDQGFPLPVHGSDSTYGPETAQAVSDFKSFNQISPSDGVVGPKTMQKLDDLFASEPGPAIVLGQGEMTVDDFLESEQDAESANSSDTPEQFLTRLRQLYYPGTDPNGLTFREVAFDQLMVTSPVRESNGTRRILGPRGMSAVFFARLASRAFENAAPPAAPDNPSPYVVDDTATRVDIGHALLTVEAIFHPVAGLPYTTFGVPPIDPASWVADLGIAATWAEQNGQPDAPRVLGPDPAGRDNIDGYEQMSAPDADLVGDIDGFNIANIWIGSGGNLSVPLAAYYLDTDAGPGGYRRRFRDFLFGQGLDVDNPSSWRSQSAFWETRVNRFNDIFSIGAVASFLTLSPPPPKSWRWTPEVVEFFWTWLETGLSIEQDAFD
jgi:hypothetical protein